MNVERGARGRFWTLEGVEGAGKTTQAEILLAWLRSSGRDVVAVREPGGTDLGERLRAIVLSQESEPIDPRSELFLYLAARAQLVSRVIRPALDRGAIVLADRFGDATVAYQGGGRRLGIAATRSFVHWTTGGLKPERTWLIDLAPEDGALRVRSRGGAPDRLESEAIEFHRRVRRAYLTIAGREPERVHVLDGTLPVDALAEAIRADATALLSSS
ncbi:MAG: dTMP kinase [Candidatus Eisenbacteria bacterium]